MKHITSAQDVRRLGTILGVWAHPDDESFTAAGILAAAVQNGQRVICITATKGEAGKTPDENRWPARQLAAIRQAELAAALQTLGITEHHWLDYPDFACADVPVDEAVQRLREYIAELQPNSILTFGPDGLTGHPDHCTVSRWVSAAVDASGPAVYHAVEEKRRYDEYMKALDQQHDIYFNINQPPLYDAAACDIALQLGPELVAKKKAALLAMPSQYEAMFGSLSPTTLSAVLALECFIDAQWS